MYACMYVCMYVYFCMPLLIGLVSKYIYLCSWCTYVRVERYNIIPRHVYLHIYIYIYKYVCMHVCIRTCVHAYVYTYIRTYIHTYMHACIHAYRQTDSQPDGRTDRQTGVCVWLHISHVHLCTVFFLLREPSTKFLAKGAAEAVHSLGSAEFSATGARCAGVLVI